MLEGRLALDAMSEGGGVGKIFSVLPFPGGGGGGSEGPASGLGDDAFT